MRGILSLRVGELIMIKFKQTYKMQELDAEITLLEQELDKLRKPEGHELGIVFYDRTRIRELRDEIAKLEKEYYDISFKVNREWHSQKPLWKNENNTVSYV
jgi:uncharacterized small protein (DUF1192 family)